MIALRFLEHKGKIGLDAGHNVYEVMVEGEVVGFLNHHLAYRWPNHDLVFQKVPYCRRLHAYQVGKNCCEIRDGEGRPVGEIRVTLNRVCNKPHGRKQVDFIRGS
jgi:hypothetical protein